MRALALAVLLVSITGSGCVAELVGPGELTSQQFACEVLTNDRVRIQVLVEDATALSEAGVAPLRAELQRVAADGLPGGRDVDVRFDTRRAQGAWTDSRLADEAQRVPVLQAGTVTARVYWLQSHEEPHRTLANVGPGIVAVFEEPVWRAAAARNASADDVAAVVLLHAFGHALGVVNDGIPVVERSIGNREGPPKHDWDPASVMSVHWHHADTMQWTEGTAPAWPASAHADWAFAAREGVCA